MKPILYDKTGTIKLGELTNCIECLVEEERNDLAMPATRYIRKIGRLFDVSIVDTPAYDGTSLEARSKEIAEARTKSEAEAEERALKELENSNKLKAEAEAKAFELRKRRLIALYELGGR